MHVPPERRKIGMVFQDYALFPHLDVERNVAFGPRRGAQRASRRWPRCWRWWGWAAARSACRTSSRAASSNAWPGARAGARPQLLLLDEPFSNLDVDLRERLAHEIRGILKAAQATALFVTHDQEAFAIGDVIGVMHEGHLHQWDDAYTLYHRPATRFVADFIGHGVFAPATLKRVGNQVVVHTALGALTDGAECLPAAFGYGQCEVLLRADDIVHDDDAPVKAQIVRKAFRGSEFLYTPRLATGETLLAHVPSHHDHRGRVDRHSRAGGPRRHLRARRRRGTAHGLVPCPGFKRGAAPRSPRAGPALHPRRSRPFATCGVPKRTCATKGRPASVRHKEATSVSSPR